jgi:hypothetical protein
VGTGSKRLALRDVFVPEHRYVMVSDLFAGTPAGRKITEAEARRARRDMTFAQHQVGWALERLCELSGARWVYDTDPRQKIRRDVMTILTHHAASRQAAMVPYGHMLLRRDAE